jgi:type VI secretion system protein ImpL
MKAIFLFLLAVVILILLAVFSWLFVLAMEWPNWGIFAVFFGVLGLYFGIIAARRFYIISRSKSKLLASQKASVRLTSETDNFKFALAKKWKSVIDMLKQSQLRRFGNPLYVLPWYMVIGESGSGKTTAISRSCLSSILRQTAETKKIVQTLNCDWWFFNQAIILDTAGRYVSPDNIDQDLEEWNYLLELFAKYRSGEGLNGLVIVVTADDLLAGDTELLESRGRALRERIDHLMRVFEKRFPIYVMVTKSDQIYGFTNWVENLSDIESQEAMGYLSEETADLKDDKHFVNSAIDTIVQRLQDMRLDMAVRGVKMSPEMLMFPGEVQRLHGGLQIFLNSVFGENPYLEHPYLRGLFLTSGRQEGSLPSRLNSILPVNQPDENLPDSKKGLFIHDVFARILPKERYVFLPGEIVSRWRKVTNNIALSAWLLFCSAFIIFLIVSFQTTSNTIDRFRAAIPKEFAQAVSVHSKDRKSEVVDLETLLVVVNLLLNEGKNWQTSWLAFSPDVRQLESTLKQAFVKRFRDIQANKSGVNRRDPFIMNNADPAIRAYAFSGAIRYINMVQARINGADFEQIIAMPQVPKALLKQNALLTEDVQDQFGNLVSAAIAWSDPSDPYLAESLKNTRALLSAEVFKTVNTGWVLAWANQQPDISAITLSNFWNPSLIGNQNLVIQPAFTLKGEKAIFNFIDELKEALQNSPEFIANSISFRQLYMNDRFNAWQSFAQGFTGDGNLVGIEPVWRELIQSLGTKNSPFYLFLSRLTKEFANLDQEKSPPWLNFARYYFDLQNQTQSTMPLKNTMSVVTAINTVAGGAIRRSIDTGSMLLPEAVSSANNDLRLFQSYQDQLLKSTALALGGPDQNFQMARRYFSGTTNEEKSSELRDLTTSLANFKKDSKYNRADDEAIWNVIGGPINALINYVLEQASCQVQQDWDRNVIWKSQLAINPKEASEQLFGKDGTVWALVDGPNRYFINRKGGSFSIAELNGDKLPFAIGFVTFLNQAVTSRVGALVREERAKTATSKSAKLSLSALPLAVNASAKSRPYSAVLSIQCAQEPIELSNLNMKASSSFAWSPEQCGETTLQLKIDNLTLTKRYPGPMGLPTMLQEFQEGARVFTPNDFPAAAGRLDELGVTEITVRYDMEGAESVLQLAQDYDYLTAQTTPSTQSAVSRMDIAVPVRAGRCWTGVVAQDDSMTLPKYIAKEAEKKVNPPPPPIEQPLPPVEPLKPVPTKDIVVQKGDTLFSIGKKYNVDPLILRSLNNLKNDTIIEGSQLLVPIWPVGSP